MSRHLHALTIVLATSVIAQCGQAAVVESFDNPSGANGQVLFGADAIYSATGASPSGGDKNGNSSFLNGYILQTNNFTPFNNPGTWGVIGHDQSGPGYYLWEGTNTNSTPSYAGKVWQSLSLVPVVPNTAYQFSFYLANSNSIGNYAIIQPSINGVSLGSGVSASGYFTDGNSAHGWQQFAFTWNSQLATTADLRLANLQSNNNPGDDFGIDTIGLTAVPEPSCFIVLLACTAVPFFSRSRRATA